VFIIIHRLSILSLGLAIEDVISAKIVYDEYLKQNEAESESFLPGFN